ncbi:hypothetical protein B0H17DRAFT_1261170 [Mycena rosella]|uniref:Uncharacterized protein n=1 Tax=Mycena rosella TaxID=1033263 RepID=A0AAD7DS42_MYCRO|nr:hypothetical protein B0H17DRAFT_1261170 [Mycena rosella]
MSWPLLVFHRPLRLTRCRRVYLMHLLSGSGCIRVHHQMAGHTERWISDTVLDALTLRTEDALPIYADRPPVLPHLQYIKIAGSYIFRDRALVRTLSSHALPSPGRHALTAVELTLRSRRVSTEDVAQLRALSAAEIRVGLVFDPGQDLSGRDLKISRQRFLALFILFDASSSSMIDTYRAELGSRRTKYCWSLMIIV